MNRRELLKSLALASTAPVAVVSTAVGGGTVPTPNLSDVQAGLTGACDQLWECRRAIREVIVDVVREWYQEFQENPMERLCAMASSRQDARLRIQKRLNALAAQWGIKGISYDGWFGVDGDQSLKMSYVSQIKVRESSNDGFTFLDTGLFDSEGNGKFDDGYPPFEYGSFAFKL